MRPKKHATTGSGDLIRARLEQIINMKHELVLLAGKIEWQWIDSEIAPLYSDKGRRRAHWPCPCRRIPTPEHGTNTTSSHAATDGHLGRCYLKGREADAANAILSAIGQNPRLVLAC